MRNRKNKAQEPEKIPNEVYWVWAMLYLKQPVGITAYNEIERIIKQYPEHFPWETVYGNIPNDVHEAYRLEAYGPTPVFDSIPIGRGWEDEIKEMENGSIKMPYTGKCTEQDLIDFLDLLGENERKEEEEQRRLMAIWKKHYGKYNLSYRK